MKSGEGGFTVLELMAVLAIIGILAVVAFPVYGNYTKRTKMTEVVLAVSACRTPVTELYQLSKAAPGGGNWGCEVGGPASKYVQSIATDPNGKITVVAGGFKDATIDGQFLTMVPLIAGVAAVAATDMGKAVTSWRCGSAGDGTNIPANFLPSSCRAP